MLASWLKHIYISNQQTYPENFWRFLSFLMAPDILYTFCIDSWVSKSHEQRLPNEISSAASLTGLKVNWKQLMHSESHITPHVVWGHWEGKGYKKPFSSIQHTDGSPMTWQAWLSCLTAHHRLGECGLLVKGQRAGLRMISGHQPASAHGWQHMLAERQEAKPSGA